MNDKSIVIETLNDILEIISNNEDVYYSIVEHIPAEDIDKVLDYTITDVN